jgi:TPR repeat protein
MLKGEADKSNVRARSTLGSMYATGHCVSRDLPTAYRYFALVLRTDPENGVASQNLQNLWKQMTPPERQAAMRQQ